MSFFSLFCTCKSIQNESQNVGKLRLGTLKLREKDAQYRQNCPRGASRWFKVRSRVGKSVRWPPRGPPRTHLGTQLGVHLVSLGRQNESTEPVLKQNSVPERVQECQKCIKWKSAKTLKNHGFSMVFDGFSWCRGIIFEVLFVKFCENSISWEKLSEKLWFGAQGNVFCKNEAQDESKGASEGSLESSRGSRHRLGEPRLPQFQRPGRSLRIKDPWKSSPAGCKLQTVDWKQDARGLTRRWARRFFF